MDPFMIPATSEHLIGGTAWAPQEAVAPLETGFHQEAPSQGEVGVKFRSPSVSLHKLGQTW